MRCGGRAGNCGLLRHSALKELENRTSGNEEDHGLRDCGTVDGGRWTFFGLRTSVLAGQDFVSFHPKMTIVVPFDQVFSEQGGQGHISPLGVFFEGFAPHGFARDFTAGIVGLRADPEKTNNRQFLVAHKAFWNVKAKTIPKLESWHNNRFGRPI